MAQVRHAIEEGFGNSGAYCQTTIAHHLECRWAGSPNNDRMSENGLLTLAPL
ncbi:hypothetical protein TUM17382_05290 [Shewanella algae]|nr:hypothetical protein TUM17382_05290 [Shewanella algae]